ARRVAVECVRESIGALGRGALEGGGQRLGGLGLSAETNLPAMLRERSSFSRHARSILCSRPKNARSATYSSERVPSASRATNSSSRAVSVAVFDRVKTEKRGGLPPRGIASVRAWTF